MKKLQKKLARLRACSPSIKWAGGYADPISAWRACPRADWLLWLAVKLGVERGTLARAACACARLALPFTHDDRPVRTLLITERWCCGDRSVTIEDVFDAAEAAREAALDAGCHAKFDAANAAYAAAFAAQVVIAEEQDKEAASAAAQVTADAAAEAALNPAEGDAARDVVLLKAADIVRRCIDEGTILSLWKLHSRPKGVSLKEVENV